MKAQARSFGSVVIAASLVFSQGLWAQNSGLMSSAPTDQAAPVSGSSEGLMQREALPQYNPELNASTGLREDAKKAADSQKGAMNAALASAAITAAIAAATCPNPKMQPTCTAATLGTMAGLAIAAMMNNAKNKSNQQHANVSAGATATDTAPITSNKSYQATKRSISETTKRNGGSVDLDKNTVKLADGRKVSLDDLSSPGAMAAAGLKPGEIKALGDLLKEANEKAAGQVAKAADGEASDEAFGGGGSRTVFTDGGSSGGGSSFGEGRKPADITGATRNFNGAKIGVAAESIFVMMNRRYQHEASQKKPGFL